MARGQNGYLYTFDLCLFKHFSPIANFHDQSLSTRIHSKFKLQVTHFLIREKTWTNILKLKHSSFFKYGPKDRVKTPTSEILVFRWVFIPVGWRKFVFNHSEILDFTLTLVLLQSYKHPEGLKKQILIKTLRLYFQNIAQFEYHVTPYYLLREQVA